MDSIKGVSVIICCFNSAFRLPETVRHITYQKLPNISWEVIIVDNASTDDTNEVANKLCNDHFKNIISYKIVEETRQGLSFAREKGIFEAQYDYLLFCDDDNWISENYIAMAFEVMEANPRIGIVGGSSKAISTVDLPVWFSTFQSGYAVGVQAMDSGNISFRGHVWGAAMVLRKSVLSQLIAAGFRSLLTGRNGEQLTAGDDAEICKWFIIAGYDLWYEEALFFQHFVPENRLTKAYLKKLHEGFESAAIVLDKYDNFINHVVHKKQYKIKNFLGTAYHGFKYIILKNKTSSLYLSSKSPLIICRIVDEKFYSIRQASKKLYRCGNRSKLPL